MAVKKRTWVGRNPDRQDLPVRHKAKGYDTLEGENPDRQDIKVVRPGGCKQVRIPKG